MRDQLLQNEEEIIKTAVPVLDGAAILYTAPLSAKVLTDHRKYAKIKSIHDTGEGII